MFILRKSLRIGFFSTNTDNFHFFEYYQNFRIWQSNRRFFEFLQLNLVQFYFYGNSRIWRLFSYLIIRPNFQFYFRSLGSDEHLFDNHYLIRVTNPQCKRNKSPNSFRRKPRNGKFEKTNSNSLLRINIHQKVHKIGK